MLFGLLNLKTARGPITAAKLFTEACTNKQDCLTNANTDGLQCGAYVHVAMKGL